MYVLNKIVWFFLNPVVVPLVGALVGGVLASKGRRGGKPLLFASIAFLWFTATLTCACMLGLPLEREYLKAQTPESLPQADAIVLLGGGIAKTDETVYPDMYDGADRVWHAARLWKAGKAPIVVVSGCNDLAAAVPLLLDFGVPREAIVVDDKSRNTYENSRFTEALLKDRAQGRDTPCRILLVTSAWHMTRARGNFAKTSLHVTPAACDFCTHTALGSANHWWDWVAPSADSLMRTSFLFKEWLGRLARR